MPDDLRHYDSFQIMPEDIAGSIIGIVCACVVIAWLLLDVYRAVFG